MKQTRFFDRNICLRETTRQNMEHRGNKGGDDGQKALHAVPEVHGVLPVYGGIYQVIKRRGQALR